MCVELRHGNGQRAQKSRTVVFTYHFHDEAAQIRAAVVQEHASVQGDFVRSEGVVGDVPAEGCGGLDLRHPDAQKGSRRQMLKKLQESKSRKL